jgi:hypothetical protein
MMLVKSVGKFVFAVAGAFVAASGVAHATALTFNVPEPGSLALVGLAVAGLVAFSRKK